MPHQHRLWLWIAVAVVIVAIVSLYAIFDPATTPFPRCILLSLTGYKCPGCGSQRAIHALLNADIASAWRYNALMVCALPLLAVLFLAGLMRRKWPHFYNAVNSRPVILTVLIAVIAWWILRNILNF